MDELVALLKFLWLLVCAYVNFAAYCWSVHWILGLAVSAGPFALWIVYIKERGAKGGLNTGDIVGMDYNRDVAESKALRAGQRRGWFFRSVKRTNKTTRYNYDEGGAYVMRSEPGDLKDPYGVPMNKNRPKEKKKPSDGLRDANLDEFFGKKKNGGE
jgi:hypothetical protein